MSVIELGELTQVQPVQPPGPRFRPRLSRRVAAALVAVMLLALAGSTAVPAPTIRDLWATSVPMDAVVSVGPHLLYLNRPDRGTALLNAYDLGTGALRWTVPAGPVVRGITAVAGGVLLMPDVVADLRRPLPDGSFLHSDSVRSTIARDADTGATVWRQPGDAIQADGEHALLAEYDALGGTAALRMVRLRDGALVWRRPTRGLEAWAVSTVEGRPDALVTAVGQGQLTVLGYADGTVRRTGRVPWTTPERPGDDGRTELTAAGGRLIVARSGGPDGGGTTVYRLDTLTALWRTTWPLADCGPVLCTPESFLLQGFDPATGAVRWRQPGVSNAIRAGGDRILARLATSGDRYQLLDARTGRLLDGRLTGVPVWRGDPPDGPVLLMRDTKDPPDRSAVLELDPATGEAFLLGAIRHPGAPGCQVVPGYLICPGGGAVSVTAVG